MGQGSTGNSDDQVWCTPTPETKLRNEFVRTQFFYTSYSALIWSTRITNQNADSSFFGSLAVGTPPVSFNVILDTGSAYVTY